MKKHLYTLLLVLLAGLPSHAGVYSGSTDDATFNRMLGDVDARITALDQKIQEAQTAGVTTAYAQVSQVTIDLFRNSFAPWDRANPAQVQSMYDAKNFSQWDPVGPVGLPFDELADAIEVADSAIAELNAQIAGTLTLQDPIDFASGSVVLNGPHYEQNGRSVFPSKFFWQPEAENVMQAFGRMGEGYYSVQFMDSPTVVRQSRINSFSASMQNQADVNRTPAQFFLGHIVPDNHVMRTTIPEAFSSGTRLFTDYDIDHPEVRDWLTVLFQDMMSVGVSSLIGHERVHMMSNEPTFAIREGGVNATRGVSSITMQKYGDWLQAKYGDIATLNTTYGTAHADFDAVRAAYPIPLALSFQGGPVWYDWNRFNMYRVNDWFTFLHNGHRAIDPDGRTHIKLMGERSVHVDFNDEGLDFEYITKLVDIPGSDAQMTPLASNWDARFDQDWRARWVLEWRAQSIMLDFMKSISPDKPTFDSEWHGLSGSRWRDFHMSREYVRASLWHAMTNGLSAMNAWVWNRREDGSIDTRADFIGTSVTQPIQLDAFGRAMKELNAHGDAVAAMVPAERNFLVYYSADSAIQDPTYTGQMADVYEALKILNIPVGFTTPTELANVSTASQAVIVPPTPYISDTDFAALQDFSANGGTLAVVDASGNFGETELGATRANTQLISPVATFGGVFTMADAFAAELDSRIPDLPLLVDVSDGVSNAVYGVQIRQYESNNRHIVSLINVSQDSRSISLEVSAGVPNDVDNLITGAAGTANFSMAPMDVLLLSVAETVDAPPPPPPPPSPAPSGGGGSFGLLSLLVFALFAWSGRAAAASDSPLPASDPSNHGGWVLNEDLSDEFNGAEIDHDKWLVQGLNGDYYIWKGRPPSQYAPHNVVVEDGFLKIRTQWEPDFAFAQENYADGGRDDRYGELDGKKIPVTTAAVVSKKRFLNGYMEIRSKSNPTSMTSAFWAIGFEQELDIFEHVGAPQTPGSFGADHTTMTVHDWSPPAVRPTRAFGFSTYLPYKVGDEYHLYAVEWGVDYVKFYLDGELLHTQTREHLGLDWVLNNPLEIWLDSEVFKWIAVPHEDEQWPSDFEIDYVRIWQKPSSNLLQEHEAFYGFEGPMIFDDAGRPLDLLPEDPTPNDYQKFWIIPEDSQRSFRIIKNRWYNGVNSLKYLTIGGVGDVVARAPEGSIELPAGEYELSFKILLKHGYQPANLHMNLNSPKVALAFPLQDEKRGEWITLRKRFVREAASNPDDYLSIEVLASELPPGARDFFIDDIRIEAVE